MTCHESSPCVSHNLVLEPFARNCRHRAAAQHDRYTDKTGRSSDYLSSGLLPLSSVQRGVWLLRDARAGRDGVALFGVSISSVATGEEETATGFFGQRGQVDHVGLGFEAPGPRGQRRAVGAVALAASCAFIRRRWPP